MLANFLNTSSKSPQREARLRFALRHVGPVMESVSEVRSFFEAPSEDRLVQGSDEQWASSQPSTALSWYRILRVQCQWPLFEAIRYALWLTR